MTHPRYENALSPAEAAGGGPVEAGVILVTVRVLQGGVWSDLPGTARGWRRGGVQPVWVDVHAGVGVTYPVWFRASDVRRRPEGT
mgnify:CR=1 FL=1